MRRFSRQPLLVATLLISAAFSAWACGDDENDGNGDNNVTDDGSRVHGLTPEQAAETIAQVGDTEITTGQLAEELASKGSFVRTRYNSPERRRELLDQMIRFELMAQEAERRGYNDAPEVVRTRKQMMIRRFLEERFEQGGPESITDEDVAEYYEAHRTEFHTPQQVRASHIQMRDRAAAERVLSQLRESQNDLRLYRQLAEQHNTHAETRDRFGDLRFFSRPDERTDNEPEVPAEVATAAFEIEGIGGIHPELVHSGSNYHIVKLTGRRAAMHRTLAEASRPIRARLWRERREAGIETLLEELRAESDVEENLEMLEFVRVDVPEGDSPSTSTQIRGQTPTLPPQRPAPRNTP